MPPVTQTGENEMNNATGGDTFTTNSAWLMLVCAIGMTFCLYVVPGSGAEEKPGLDNLAGQPAELSAWAYAYRADLKVQKKPEAGFVLRRQERLDQVYRPVSLWLSEDSEKKHARKPPHPGLLSRR
jgi:hypothetical protein